MRLVIAVFHFIAKRLYSFLFRLCRKNRASTCYEAAGHLYFRSIFRNCSSDKKKINV